MDTYRIVVLFIMVSFSRYISSRRGGQLLVDTDGYIYTVKNKLKTKTTYTCRTQKRKRLSNFFSSALPS